MSSYPLGGGRKRAELGAGGSRWPDLLTTRGRMSEVVWRAVRCTCPLGDSLVHPDVLLGGYVVDERLLGHRRGGLAIVGIVFVLALVASWVLRKVSGTTWREALWPPRRKPPPLTQLPPSVASVSSLAQAGRRIQAIQMYRELTGVDLNASVEAVDSMIAQPRLHKPAAKIDPQR